jgi:hypothetical protein
MENEALYDWVFRFNPMDGKWYCAKRDHYNDLFSNMNSEHLLKSSSIKTLIELINKTDGDMSKLEKLIKK